MLLWTIAPVFAAEQVRTTVDGVLPLDEPILFRVRGVLLQVPAGYLWPWPMPHQHLRGRINDEKDIDFDFWMPDRRYLEVNPFSYVGFQPKENGRESPGPDRYTVRVRGLELDSTDVSGHLSPADAFRNLTSIAGQSSYAFREEAFGLERFWQANWPYPQPEPFTNYRHLQGSDPQVLLHCTPPSNNLPVPLCEGIIQFTADRLSFRVVFPRDRLPEWRKIVFAVRDLVTEWTSKM